MNIYTDWSFQELETVFWGEDEMQIQFTKPPTNVFCEYLNQKLIEFPHVRVRFYSYEEAFKDLAFLENLTNIKKLCLDDSSVQNIEVLKNIRGLQSLKLSRLKNKKIDISVLIRLEKLRILECEGIYGLRSIFMEKTDFEQLYLTSVDLGSLCFLNDLINLSHLDLSNCHCTDYSAIGHCQKIEYLFLEKIKLENVDFISDLLCLKSLSLNNLAIINLPNFEKCTNLEKVFLTNLSQLLSFNGLEIIKKLEVLQIKNVMALNLKETNFLQFTKTIKRVEIASKDKTLSKFFDNYFK